VGRPAWVVAAGLLLWAVTYLLAFVLQVVPFWPAMVVLSAVSWWVAWQPDLPGRLRPARHLVAIGAASGLSLYGCFVAGALVVRQTTLWPLVGDVAGLARTTAPAPLAVLVIVLGTSPSEEVLWRGAVFARVAGRLRPGRWSLVVTTVLYALFVGMSGNPLLSLAALVCGVVWTRQRQVTGSLVPGIVSHALWSSLMFLYLPGSPNGL
jgi:membrane protease YdiL (CAAX protease family)